MYSREYLLQRMFLECEVLKSVSDFILVSMRWKKLSLVLAAKNFVLAFNQR